MSNSIKLIFPSHIAVQFTCFLLILQRNELKSIIYMNQTEEDETWKIEALSTHNSCELKSDMGGVDTI